MNELGNLPPEVRVPPPGPRSLSAIERLAQAECPALTARRARRAERTGAPQDPIVWAAARGSNVTDVDGNRYVDLTSGFGVTILGHQSALVQDSLTEQLGELTHALGDVCPSEPKVALLERLARLGPWREGGRVILGLSGSDAVTAALKTALLATGNPHVLAFEGGYHGLGYGPLATCGYQDSFRTPFREQLNPHVTFVPFPQSHHSLEEAIGAIAQRWPAQNVGAVLVEPIQGRGGIRLPPPGFLGALGELCRSRGALLIADEIFTGLGRCGALLYSVHGGAQPDLICLGKALGGGLPVSACLGRPEVMAAWGDPAGEAIHTGTFFGQPLGCRGALTTLQAISDQDLCERSRSLGERAVGWLREATADLREVVEVRGAGLAIGVSLDRPGAGLVLTRRLLGRGYLTLASGADASVLQIAPALTIAPERLQDFADELRRALSQPQEPADAQPS